MDRKTERLKDRKAERQNARKTVGQGRNNSQRSKIWFQRTKDFFLNHCFFVSKRFKCFLR